MCRVAFAMMLFIAIAMTGCVSIEDQLNSPDPTTRMRGEQRLLKQSRLSGTVNDRVEAVKRVQTPQLLMEVARSATIPEGRIAVSKLANENDLADVVCTAQALEIRHLAFAKIKDQHAFLKIATKSPDASIRKAAMDSLSPESLAQLPYSHALIPYWRKMSDQKTLARIYRDGCGTLPAEDLNGLAAKIGDNAVLCEMVVPIPGQQAAILQRNRENEIFTLSGEIKALREKSDEYNQEADRAKENWELSKEKRERRKASEFLAKVAEVQQRLNTLKNTPVTGLYITNDTARAVLYGQIKDPAVFVTILGNSYTYNPPLFSTERQLKPILAKIPEDRAFEFALCKLEYFGIHSWSENNLVPLEIAKNVVNAAKESKTRVSLASAALSKLGQIKTELKENPLRYMCSWHERQETFAVDYTRSFNLTYDEKMEVLQKKGQPAYWVVACSDDETLAKIALCESSYQKIAFDGIKDAGVKERTLSAIKENLQKRLTESKSNYSPHVTVFEEIKNGIELREFLCSQSKMTQLQRTEFVNKMKDRFVILKGTVREVSGTGKADVSILLAESDSIVQVKLPEALFGSVKQWSQGDTQILRGKFEKLGTGFSRSVSCGDGDIVTKEQYEEMLGYMRMVKSLEWQVDYVGSKHALPERVPEFYQDFSNGKLTRVNGKLTRIIDGELGILRNTAESMDASVRALDALRRGELGEALDASMESMKNNADNLRNASDMIDSLRR